MDRRLLFRIRRHQSHRLQQDRRADGPRVIRNTASGPERPIADSSQASLGIAHALWNRARSNIIRLQPPKKVRPPPGGENDAGRWINALAVMTRAVPVPS